MRAASAEEQCFQHPGIDLRCRQDQALHGEGKGVSSEMDEHPTLAVTVSQRCPGGTAPQLHNSQTVDMLSPAF